MFVSIFALSHGLHCLCRQHSKVDCNHLKTSMAAHDANCFCRSLFQVDSMGFQFAQVLTYLTLGDIDSGGSGCWVQLMTAYRIRSPYFVLQ